MPDGDGIKPNRQLRLTVNGAEAARRRDGKTARQPVRVGEADFGHRRPGREAGGVGERLGQPRRGARLIGEESASSAGSN